LTVVDGERSHHKKAQETAGDAVVDDESGIVTTMQHLSVFSSF
jgi:hypothetical protein